MGAATIQGDNVPNYANGYERKSQDDRKLASKLASFPKSFATRLVGVVKLFPNLSTNPSANVTAIIRDRAATTFGQRNLFGKKFDQIV